MVFHCVYHIIALLSLKTYIFYFQICKWTLITWEKLYFQSHSQFIYIFCCYILWIYSTYIYDMYIKCLPGFKDVKSILFFTWESFKFINGTLDVFVIKTTKMQRYIFNSLSKKWSLITSIQAMIKFLTQYHID